MKTEIRYQQDNFVISTTLSYALWEKGGDAFRALVHQYHAIRAAQALEAATEQSYICTGTGRIGEEYRDVDLARRGEIAVYTVFYIKHRRDHNA